MHSERIISHPQHSIYWPGPLTSLMLTHSPPGVLEYNPGKQLYEVCYDTTAGELGIYELQ